MQQEIQEQIRQYCSYLQEWNASYEEYAKSVGLSYTTLSILSAIYENEECTQKFLCKQRFLPKQTVNTVIVSFNKKGWVRLEARPEDRRNKTIHLTDTGRAEAERILQKVRQSERQAMSELTDEERKVLLSATRRYVLGCKKAMKGL